jgi:hypothetical protein
MTSGQIPAASDVKETVWSHNWWSTPFKPVLSSSGLEEAVRRELGQPKPDPGEETQQSDPMSRDVLALVQWIEQEDESAAASILKDWQKSRREWEGVLPQADERFATLVNLAEKSLSAIVSSDNLAK